VSARHYLVLIVVAAVVTLVLTPLVKIMSVKLGVIDQPGGRKVHVRPVARLGGVAMFCGFGAALVAQWVGETWFNWGGNVLSGGLPLWGAIAGIVTIFVVGVIDDIITMRPSVKLLGQIVAAIIVMACGLRIEFVGNPITGGLVDIGMLSWPVTLLWIVGFTNVINLIDGLDGLAAGVAAIAAMTFLVIANDANFFVAATFAAAIVGCTIGFLRYNFNPASIFMGDSGSMFLGFTLGVISMAGVMKSVAAITLVVPLLVIGVPVFDTASAIIRRARHGQPIQEADKGHIHHRLLGRGFNQRQTVLIIYMWSGLLALGGYAMRFVPFILKIGVFVVLGILSAFMAYWLGLFEAVQAHTVEEDEA
jgi:UDP-GlcNAc:undecaprenyl-phosphate GlcNAc-1-phosphate transferase